MHVLIHWTDALPVSSQELLTAEQGVIGLILWAGPILGNEDTAFALQMLHLCVEGGIKIVSPTGTLVLQ